MGYEILELEKHNNCLAGCFAHGIHLIKRMYLTPFLYLFTGNTFYYINEKINANTQCTSDQQTPIIKEG